LSRRTCRADPFFRSSAFTVMGERTADLQNRSALVSKESFAEAGGVGHLHGRRQVVVEWAEVTPHPARDG